MHSHSIKIGPRFFACAFRDYRDWKWAYAREACQNCIDAPGSTHIKVSVAPDTDAAGQPITRVTFSNNGSPMDRDTLVTKFLALGGSGKECQGTVGGFGKAKELLAFCHRDWRIRTGTLLAEGVGGDYDLRDDLDYVHGTETTVTMDGDVAADIIHQFRSFIRLSQWRGLFELNGQAVEERLRKGQGRRNLGETLEKPEGWGRVYTNKDVPDHARNTLIVRVAGTPMFRRHVNFDGAVIVEINGTSMEVLQSSRDSLKWNYGSELDEFCQDLITNKRKALVDKRPVTERIRFSGYKLNLKQKPSPYLNLLLRDGGISPDPISGAETVRVAGKHYGVNTPEGHVAAALANLVKATADPTSSTYAQTGAKHRPISDLPLRPEFILKNETGLKIPDYYTPDCFSAYAKGLIWRWMGILVTLADLYGSTAPFTVGFIFTEEDTLAQYEKIDDHGVIYIRPAEIVRHDGKAPVIKASWSLSGGAIWDLVSYAAHEFTHYNWGLSLHDEAFAAHLTEVMGVCLKERSRLAKVFQSRVEWPDTSAD